MKIDRLMYILIMLLSKERILAKDIAEKFQVSTRTIYRDMDTLTLVGIPIYTERGNNGGFILANNYKLDTFLFTEEEQELIINISDSVSKIASLPNFETLKHKINLSNIANTTKSSYFFDFSLWKNNKNSLHNIEKAIDNSLVVQFKYTSFNNKDSIREVEPINIIFKAHAWYLYGFSKERNNFRVFRLSRIRDLKILDFTFESSKYEKISNSFGGEVKVISPTSLQKKIIEISKKILVQYDTM